MPAGKKQISLRKKQMDTGPSAIHVKEKGSELLNSWVAKANSLSTLSAEKKWNVGVDISDTM